MPNQLEFRLLYALCCISMWASDARAEQHPARFTAEELRARMADTHSRIQSIYVEYQSSQGDYTTDKFPKGTYVHTITCMRQPGDFYQDFAHGQAAVEWRKDPFRRRAIISAGKWFSVTVYSRYFS